MDAADSLPDAPQDEANDQLERRLVQPLAVPDHARAFAVAAAGVLPVMQPRLRLDDQRRVCGVLMPGEVTNCGFRKPAT